MSIYFDCPHCGGALETLNKHAGKYVKCTACAGRLRVPQRQEDHVRAARDAAPEQGRPPTDAPGVLGLVLGCVGLLCLVMGYFTGGITYYVAAPLALAGVGLGARGRGNLRIAGLALSVLALAPSSVVLALFLKGYPVTWTAKPAPEPLVQTESPPPAAGPQTAPAPAKPAPEPEPEWYDARKGPVRHGDVLVQVTGTKIDRVKLQDAVDGDRQSEAPQLLIFLQIGNTSKTQKIDYRGWQANLAALDDLTKLGDLSRLQEDLLKSRMKLTDNFGNSYKEVNFGLLSTVVGQLQKESIYPNAVVADVLVFEVPLANVKYVRLELPAANIGGTGKVRLHIPQEMIQR